MVFQIGGYTSMNERNSNVKLSPEQQEELLRMLMNRFEKNTSRHEGLGGPKYKQDWKRMPKSYGRSMKWKEPAASRILSVVI